MIFLPKQDFSENENRYLQKYPQLSVENIINGKFMNLMTNYVADHFPLREELLNFKTNIYKILGVTRQGDIYYAEDDYLIEEYQKPLNNEKIVDIINRFINNNVGINYSFMLVPTSTSILKDKLPKYNLNYDQKETINYFKKHFNGSFIDVYDALLNNNSKYIYYRTDHHWTTEGAYYAYIEYCMVNEFIPNKYSFESVSNEFYGTFYSKVIDNSLPYDIIMRIIDKNQYKVYYSDSNFDFMYNNEFLEKKDKYSYFLNGNHSLVKIINYNVDNGKILIIKDSYANAFIPLIAPHYSEIHVIDPRYYIDKISDYIKDNDITDVLFLYNVGTLDDDLGILGIQ